MLMNTSTLQSFLLWKKCCSRTIFVGVCTCENFATWGHENYDDPYSTSWHKKDPIENHSCKRSHFCTIFIHVYFLGDPVFISTFVWLSWQIVRRWRRRDRKEDLLGHKDMCSSGERDIYIPIKIIIHLSTWNLCPFFVCTRMKGEVNRQIFPRKST